MPPPPAELTTLLAKLATSGAEFVLVEGLAAVAQGAPLTIQDVDVVHRRTAENVDTLLVFLREVNARDRERPDLAIGPSRAPLLGAGHNLLMTDLGPLDLLGGDRGGAWLRRARRDRSRRRAERPSCSHPRSGDARGAETRGDVAQGQVDVGDPGGDPPAPGNLIARDAGRR